MARRPPRVVLAAGGTGGHLFPAQALAEEMLGRGWRVGLATDARGASFAGDFPHEVGIVQTAAASPARGTGRIGVVRRLAGGSVRAAAGMLSDRPALVVGFGGYAAAPALAAAGVLRVPRLVHEANAVLGRANRRFAASVDAIACGMWPTEVPAGARAVHTGNPVRRAVRDRAGAAYIPPGAYPMSLLVVGGSQGARVLSDAVPRALAALPAALRANVRVAHQARPEDHERTGAFYAEHGIHAEVAPFFADLARRMSEAQLVISRAGAASIADIAAIGRPSILVPLAAALNDEQSANARGLLQAGAAIVVPEAKLEPVALSEQIETVLANPDGATQMARAALGLGRPDAAGALADLAEAVALGKEVT